MLRKKKQQNPTLHIGLSVGDINSDDVFLYNRQPVSMKTRTTALPHLTEVIVEQL